ncbi:MAG: RlmE family RNA methyltransferase [Gammaproteobacteria bacterium]
MGRSASSRRWLEEHHGDPYGARARRLGFRSRAAFKLLEIDARDRILRCGITVIDLGAAPGGWTQVAAQAVGPRGRVLAIDPLPIEPLSGVTVMTGSIFEDQVAGALRVVLDGAKADLVLSDMAPNMSGIRAVDAARALALAESARDFATEFLKPGGDFLVKVFQGAGVDGLLANLRAGFRRVSIRKPQASRSRSGEVYVLGRAYGL